LHGKVKAPNQEKTDAQGDCADKQRNKYRRNDCEFHRRGAPVVESQGFQMISHSQPNLMIAVRTIGVANVPVTVMPGNSGV
jgi:hypothetical protein